MEYKPHVCTDPGPASSLSVPLISCTAQAVVRERHPLHPMAGVEPPHPHPAANMKHFLYPFAPLTTGGLMCFVCHYLFLTSHLGHDCFLTLFLEPLEQWGS